jgi:hypothetical protein
LIDKLGPTKDALDHLGFPSIAALSILGRGRQRGIAAETSCDFQPELLNRENPVGSNTFRNSCFPWSFVMTTSI